MLPNKKRHKLHPLVAAIHEISKQNPSRAAIRWKCNDFPYAAVDGLIRTGALTMQLKGIRSGELVAFATEPGPESLIAAASLWALGAAAFPFNATPKRSLPTHTILEEATGFIHPEGGYVKTATMSGKTPLLTSSLWPHEDTGSLSTVADYQKFINLLESAEKRFNFSARTVLGLSSVAHPGAVIDLWAVLAAGGTVDLFNDHETLHEDCLLQHLRETEADLLIVPSTLPQRLDESPDTVLAQFRDVVIIESFDRNSRTRLANAFPHANFHRWDAPTELEDMSIFCPADFAAENHHRHHKPKDNHA